MKCWHVTAVRNCQSKLILLPRLQELSIYVNGKSQSWIGRGICQNYDASTGPTDFGFDGAWEVLDS